MTRVVFSICGERYEDADGQGGGWHVRRHVYLSDLLDDARLADEKYANYIINHISSTLSDGTESSWIHGNPPEELVVFFDVLVDISNFGKDDVEYAVDYQRHSFCPSQAVDDGMEIFRAIKRFGVRPANKQAKVKADKAREAAVRESRRNVFIEGREYWSEYVDKLGHVDRIYITYGPRLAKRVRRYSNGDEYLSYKGWVFQAVNCKEDN